MFQALASTPSQTEKIAARIIKKAVQKPRDGALCVGLFGELGAGKTTFIRGVAKSLGVRRAVQSPTFIIMRPLPLPKQLRGISTIYHFDWYRVNQAKDIEALGWREVLQDSANLVLVEWADKFPYLFKKNIIQVHILIYKKGRKIGVWNN